MPTRSNSTETMIPRCSRCSPLMIPFLVLFAGCGGASSTSPTSSADTSTESGDASTETTGETAYEAAADAPDVTIDAKPGTFSCGSKTCTFPAEYCLISSGGPVGAETSYACKPAPAACGGIATCACVDAELKILCGGPSSETACKVRDGGVEANCFRA